MMRSRGEKEEKKKDGRMAFPVAGRADFPASFGVVIAAINAIDAINMLNLTESEGIGRLVMLASTLVWPQWTRPELSC